MPILTDSEPSQLPHDERISFYNHEVQRLTKDLGSYLTAHQDELTGMPVSLESFQKGEKDFAVLIDLAITSVNLPYQKTYPILRDTAILLEEVFSRAVPIEGLSTKQLLSLRDRARAWIYGVATAMNGIKQKTEVA